MKLGLNGIELHYDVHGKGEPLLWLHGGMGHGPDWKYIFTEPPEGFLLLAPDLRGHGRSTGDISPTYSFRQSALDMFALLDALGIGTVKVIGLSGGGISALHMACIDPPRVDAMVVVSAPAHFPEQARAIQRVFAEEMLSESERQAMHARHRRPGQLAHLFEQAHAFADADDPDFSAADLKRISARTLIVFGDHDPLYPAQMGSDLHHAIRSSSLWMVEGGGHGPVFGDRAPIFAEAALRFLRGT